MIGKRFFAAWSAIVLISLPLQAAAPPSDGASGVYYVRYPNGLFAFRVDPWSDDLHAVRGLGRSAIGASDDEYDLYFEILGTYRPGAAHTAQGVFLFRDGDTMWQIPWKGMYDRQLQSFEWAMVNQGQLQRLQQAGQPTEQDRAAMATRRQALDAATPDAGATTSPSATQAADSVNPAAAPVAGSTSSPSTAGPATTALFSRTKHLPDVVDEKGELDFSKVLTRAILVTPESKLGIKPSPQAAAEPKKPAIPWEQQPGVIDMAIIDTLTKTVTMETKDKDTADLLRRRLEHELGITPAAGKNIRRRADYPPLDPRRPPERLVKAAPTIPDVADLPPAPPAKAAKIVPNVVGLSIEGAVAELWGAGLNPRSVECLGQSTESTKADRVVSQTPTAGSPYPPDGAMSLQWYSKPTGASVPRLPRAEEPATASPATPTSPAAPAGAVGFQPGDGAKIEGRFAAAEVYADGKGIAGGAGGAGGGLNWMIGKLDEPLFQVGIKAAKESVQRLSETKSTGDTVVTFAQKRQGGGEGVIDMSMQYQGGGNTYCYQYCEYRGFFINFAESVPTPGAALGAKATAAIEKSKQLIDLRFPK